MSDSFRIIVADDENLFVEEIAVYLSEMGHRLVASAATGAELIAQCELHHPDLVITDVVMPDMDGLEAARQIQQSQLTPVIVVSGHYDGELIERAKSVNVMSYLVKPITSQALDASIQIATQRFRELFALLSQTQELQRSLEERKLIERAKGVLMKRAGLTEDEAHRRLQQLASRKNQKITEVAVTVLDISEAFSPE